MFEYPAVKERRDELKGARKDIEVRLSELDAERAGYVESLTQIDKELYFLDGMEAAMPLFAKVAG